MTGPDGFSSVEHLSAAAVTALVDNELSARAEHRAKVHLVHCDECRDEVRRQRQAAEALRHADPDVDVPGPLLERLSRIPVDCCSGEDDATGPRPGVRTDPVRVDGCRRPATIAARVDMMIRRLQRRTPPRGPAG